MHVPFKSHIKLAGPKQTHCVPFFLLTDLLPSAWLSTSYIMVHIHYCYYCYYCYYYSVCACGRSGHTWEKSYDLCEFHTNVYSRIVWCVFFFFNLIIYVRRSAMSSLCLDTAHKTHTTLLSRRPTTRYVHSITFIRTYRRAGPKTDRHRRCWIFHFRRPPFRPRWVLSRRVTCDYRYRIKPNGGARSLRTSRVKIRTQNVADL